MKLSEAILIGDKLKQPDPTIYLSLDGTRGCAIGGALLAMGVTGQQFHDDMKEGVNEAFVFTKRPVWLTTIWKYIPWITYKQVETLSGLYVDFGLEKAVEYARSIEPQEQEPHTAPVPVQEAIAA